MALSSSSTLTDALAQLNDNLQWRGSPAKAVLALEAVEWLIFNRPKVNADGGASFNFADIEKLRGELAAFVNATNSTARSRRAYFVRGRPR